MMTRMVIMVVMMVMNAMIMVMNGDDAEPARQAQCFTLFHVGGLKKDDFHYIQVPTKLEPIPCLISQGQRRLNFEIQSSRYALKYLQMSNRHRRLAVVIARKYHF